VKSYEEEDTCEGICNNELKHLIGARCVPGASAHVEEGVVGGEFDRQILGAHCTCQVVS